MQLFVGTTAESLEGVCGEVVDRVVDPVHWRVTHLVVQLRHRHHELRLVPVEAVRAAHAASVVLVVGHAVRRFAAE